jgi:hypothetical protein
VGFLYDWYQQVQTSLKIMATIKIDNKEYDLDTLSDECKAQLASIQFVEQELARLQAQAAVLQTAKAAYLQGLKISLPVLGGSDTIKLS